MQKYTNRMWLRPIASTPQAIPVCFSATYLETRAGTMIQVFAW